MLFRVVSGSLPKVRQPLSAFLLKDNWDDWFAYSTTFSLHIVDEYTQHHRIGLVKIGQKGMTGSRVENNKYIDKDKRSPNLPESFYSLDNSFFSLGQEEDYYATLNQLSSHIKDKVLKGLNDIAADKSIYEQVKNEDVLERSLMRDFTESTVTGRFHRLTRGDATLTKFNFSYHLPARKDVESPILTFNVTPNSTPPTNIHVLIGRNGVGKTRVMQGMIKALLGRGGVEVGEFRIDDERIGKASFSSLTLVSFSAFDDFTLTTSEEDKIRFIQVGLKLNDETANKTKGMKRFADMLTDDFIESIEICREGLRRNRLNDAINILNQDDLFAESNISTIFLAKDGEWKKQTRSCFKRLSSGHKIALLTITRLVETTDEKTLVLIDEPEAHLHPPLLSALIRAVSNLLISRNGVAIIATHSPIVLQEVPKKCAWKIRRSGKVTCIDRPEQETFAANVSELTREVFGLGITKSGFHQLIKETISEESYNYEQALHCFSGQLGLEGRALARALIANRGLDAKN